MFRVTCFIKGGGCDWKLSILPVGVAVSLRRHQNSWYEDAEM